MKYKKCCLNKKARQSSLTVDMGKPVVINSFRIGPKGEVELKSNGKTIIPIEANLAKWYEREKGPKILFNMPAETDNLLVNEKNILKGYDYIYAVDTNSKIIEGELVSVCFYAKYSNATYECDMFGPIVFKNNNSVTEKTNWRELIKYILADKEYKSDFKIAIVVDSDYDNIQKYNSRELPIDSSFCLPPNFELIYASTDSGMENLPNVLISECDKLAKNYLINYNANSESNNG